jgi:cytidyltransferase-like protein
MSTTVLAHGVFDLLHSGHIAHLTEASELGDYLIVSVTSDKYANRPTGRPIHNQYTRRSMLEALRCVDEVHISDNISGVGSLEKFKPDFWVRGYDYASPLVYDQTFWQELRAAEKVGAEFRTTVSKEALSNGSSVRYESTSKIIERIRAL